MTAHLRSEEFVEHIEGTLGPERERHFEACDECRARLAEWETLAEAIREVGIVPEPSPLFWDHFSQRVQDATADEAAAPVAWWRRGWVQIGSAVGVAAAVMLAIQLRTAPRTVLEEMEPLAPGQAALFEVDPASWAFVTDLVSSVPFEELRQGTAPRADATDDMVAELTPAQRAELVRLVKLDKLDKGTGE